MKLGVNGSVLLQGLLCSYCQKVARVGVNSKVSLLAHLVLELGRLEQLGLLGHFSLSWSDCPKGNLQTLPRLFKRCLGHHTPPLLLHSVHQGSCKGPPSSKGRVLYSTSWFEEGQRICSCASKPSCTLSCSFSPSYSVYFYQCNQCHQFLPFFFLQRAFN